MKLGLHYWNFSTPQDPARIADTLADTARVAEQAGFSTFSVMDHFFQMERAGSAAEAACSIWKKWSMTVNDEIPACSATLAVSARVPAMRTGSAGVE